MLVEIWNVGGDVVLDLQYAHYWTKDGRPVDMGILTGVGIGYSQSSMKTGVNSFLPNVASGSYNINYTIKADEVKEHDGQLQLEIPLMFTLLHENGLFFNFGPRFMMPLYTPYKQNISNNENTYINAYIQETGVDVPNNAFLGALADKQEKGSDYGNKFTINIMLSAEIGYEWIQKSGNSLGLGAYAGYSVYNSYKNDQANLNPLISVVTPPSDMQGAEIKVNPATKTFVTGLGFFDVGVKLAYHFNFPKKRQNKDSRLF